MRALILWNVAPAALLFVLSGCYNPYFDEREEGTDSTSTGTGEESLTSAPETTSPNASATSTSVGGGSTSTDGGTTSLDSSPGDSDTGDRGDTESDSGDDSDSSEGTTGGPTGPAVCSGRQASGVEEFISDGATATRDQAIAVPLDPALGGDFECDPWTQNCPDGEKCSAWAVDGVGSWNATRCVPVADDPAQVGETCSVVEGPITSGLDNCAFGSTCWDLNSNTNLGTCQALCLGTPETPTCEASGSTCIVLNGGVIPLCQPLCNPLADECPEGDGCYFIGSSPQCLTDFSPEGATVGSACTSLNSCPDGTACADATSVPGCESEDGCCSSFCTVGDDSPCLDGQTCNAVYDGDAPVECVEQVGLCGT